MKKTRDFGKYMLILRVLIASVDPGNKFWVEGSSDFRKKCIINNIMWVTF